MKLVMLELKVFHGQNTSREVLVDYQTNVLEEFSDMSSIVIGISDTMGNMGKLGRLFQKKGWEHTYYTDQNFHLNAILTFKGELLYLLPLLLIYLLPSDF